MTPLERQKEIAIAFYRSIEGETPVSRERILRFYDQWLLTEEGKRLTAEEPEPKDSAYDLLVKISKQLDHMERKMPWKPNIYFEG